MNYQRQLQNEADERLRKAGLPSNEEFFTSNAPGCFYNGFEKNNNGDWIPGAELRAKNNAFVRNHQPHICECGIRLKEQCKEGDCDR